MAIIYSDLTDCGVWEQIFYVFTTYNSPYYLWEFHISAVVYLGSYIDNKIIAIFPRGGVLSLHSKDISSGIYSLSIQMWDQFWMGPPPWGKLNWKQFVWFTSYCPTNLVSYFLAISWIIPLGQFCSDIWYIRQPNVNKCE